MKAFVLSCICLLLCANLDAQDTVSLVGKFSSRYIDAVEKKASRVESQLTKQSEKVLQRLQKEQAKVYKALNKIDSSNAKAFLLNSQQQYEEALAKLKAVSGNALKNVRSYVPGLDSMNSVLKYLNKLPNSDALPGKEKIDNALTAAANAGQCLDKVTEIKKLVQLQDQQLKALAARYKDLDIRKQLKQYSKELYYYSQRVQQAKQTLNDPEKIEGEILKLLRKNKSFQNWMRQNSQLAGLFGAPNNSSVASQSLAGLQTRQSVQQALQNRLGGSLQQVSQQVNTQLQQAQSQLNSMRNRLQQLGAGSMGNGNGDMTMPDFEPNNQKTKSFLKRLEKSWNLQAIQRRGVFPNANELGLSIGYKLNDKSVIGIGTAYRFGLGESIGKMKWTNEGISLRSFIDIKWKGNLWFSGGYEQSYWSRFRSSQFNNIAWQQSALIGLTKKILLKKNKEVKLQLLYDILMHNAGNTNPIRFRISRPL